MRSRAATGVDVWRRNAGDARGDAGETRGATARATIRRARDAEDADGVRVCVDFKSLRPGGDELRLLQEL